MFPGKVPVCLPAATSKLGAFKETDGNLERGDNSIVTLLPYLSLGDAHSKCLKES